MASFKKYDEIDNHYNFKVEKFISNDNPGLQNIDFVIQDKIDGTNLSIIFDEHGRAKLASRNQYLGSVENVTFHNIGNVLQEDIYQKFIAHWSARAKNECKEFHFYCEFFGDGIQKRVVYGKKQLRIFDLRINGKYVSQNELSTLLIQSGFKELYVPIVAIVRGINEALAHSCDFQDPILEVDFDNPSEGIVIKPWNTVIYDFHGERLVIKKKSEKFAERMKKRTNKINKEKDPLPEGMVALAEEFLEYINENRVLSFFSKNGRIETMKEIPKFLPGILEDAFKDAAKDKGIEEFGKDERKVMGTVASKEIVTLLKRAMLGEF